MKRKQYIEPKLKMLATDTESLLAGGSTLDPNKGDQTVTPSDDEYDGEFGAKFHTIWEEEDNDEYK